LFDTDSLIKHRQWLITPNHQINLFVNKPNKQS